METENKNTQSDNLLNKDEQKEKRDYEKKDKPFSETVKEPGNPSLEKTFDEEKKHHEHKIMSHKKEDKARESSDEFDEQYSDENKEHGIAKDMNNREREAEKIQEEEDTKNDNREIELNKKL
ncbi:MAG: hypothetical protein JST55_09720 [Bacteroidetes bacterium]|nr:hypothetical protein [Bacteroidota bacterium]